MKKPKRLDRTIIYESEWINLYFDRVEMPSGRIVDKYHVIDYPVESVVALITNEDGDVLFIQAFRYISDSVSWELPAGSIDGGESIVDATIRELKEETGIEVHNLEKTYSFYPSNGMSTQIVHIVKGLVIDKPSQKFDTDEVLNVHWKSQAEILELIRQQEISDGVSLLALLFHLKLNIIQ